MTLNSRGILASVNIAYYSPALPLALLVCIRHGFGRVSGWFYLVLLCTVRIIGAACAIVIYTTANPSQGIITAATILETVGLSPLLLATLGLLSRL
jgi:hypothetical protein